MHGDLQVEAPSGTRQERVVFRGRTPDTVWYGIVIDPDEAGVIDVPEAVKWV